jgi:hypothetical protein
MIDLTGTSRFTENDGAVSYLYGMIAVCMVSKLTHVVPMDGKDTATFLLALNVLFGEVGLPNRLYVDAESSLLKLHREMVVTTSDKTLREHGIGIETVAAYGHSAHGSVERRMKDFGLTISHSIFPI